VSQAQLIPHVTAMSQFTQFRQDAPTPENPNVNPSFPGIVVDDPSVVGSLPGKLNVSPNGTANYSVPITVPDGTAKMTPKLSISYNSGNRNNLLGQGFSLQGLTMITRCPSNVAENGKVHGVDYTNEDRFCLNGEQLVAVKGAYGADQTEYRTYHDTQTKIISYGHAGNGPAYFKVWTKGGQVATYGQTADSKRLTKNGTAAYWALDAIDDAAQNYLTYHYQNSNHEFYPTEIDYTGNHAQQTPTYAKVVFSYESRSDTQQSWHVGLKTILDKRLSTITADLNGKPVYTYKLTYIMSQSSGRSLLSSIQEFGADGKAMRPTQFSWKQGPERGWMSDKAHLPPVQFTVNKNNDSEDNGLRFVDLNGDGKLDLVQYSAWGDKGAWLYTSTGWEKIDHYIPKVPITTDKGQDNGVRFVDLNGDGRLDMVQCRTNHGCDAWINNGTDWQEASQFKPPVPIVTADHKDRGVRFVDLNGDGRTDMMSNTDAWINTGKGWQEDSNYKPPAAFVDGSYKDNGVHLLDINGDGLVDFVSDQGVWFNQNGKWVKNDGYTLPVNMIRSDHTSNGAALIDINGDGLPDLVQHSAWGSVGTWFNTGEGWEKTTDASFNLPISLQVNTSSIIGKDNGVRFIDVNGDGRPDIVTSTKAWLNTPTGWQAEKDPYYETNCSLAGYPAPGNIVDYAGTGMAGIIINGTNSQNGNTLEQVVLKNRIQEPDLLTGIVDGLNAHTTIKYAPLTDNSVYTKGADGQYPNIDVQIPIYVVSETSSDTDLSDPTTLVPNSVDPTQHVTTYHYAGAKVNRQGLGLLGFSQVSISTNADQNTSIDNVTTYSQDVEKHLQGKPLSSETYVKTDGSSTLINETQNQWQLMTLTGENGNQYYLPYVRNITKTAYSLAGQQLSTQSTTTAIDQYDNPTDIIKKTQDNSGSYQVEVKNQYQNDATHWWIGQLTDTKVIASGYDQASMTRETQYTYDPENGMLASTIQAPNDATYKLTTTYGRDGFGHIIKTTKSWNDPQATPVLQTAITSTTYDTLHRFPVSQTNALNQTTTFDNDIRFGKPLSVTDPNGLVIQYQYDGFGRKIAEIAPDGTKTTITYHWYNHMANSAQTDPFYYAVYAVTKHTDGGIYQSKFYDKLNRQVVQTKQNSDGRVVIQSTQYDDLGRATLQSVPYFQGDPNPLYSHIEYDVLGRIIKTIKPDQSVVQIAYNTSNGSAENEIITNPNNQTAMKFKNARGKTIETIDNDGKKTFFQYDAFGNLISMEDSQQHVTTITYNALGDKIAMHDPDKGDWTYNYNALGQLTKQIDDNDKDNPKVTSFSYDKLGRMISRTDPAGTSTWTYGNDLAAHDVGKLTHVNGVSNLAGEYATELQLIQASKAGLVNYSRQISYDKLGRPNQTTVNINGTNYTTTVKYDKHSRPIDIIYPNQFEIHRYYNALGYLIAIAQAKTTHLYWMLNETNARGQIVSFDNGNNMTTTKTYDPTTGFLTDIETSPTEAYALQQQLFHHPVKKVSDAHKRSNNSLSIQSLHYAYDKLGDVRWRHNDVTGLQENFQYDNLARLTQWSQVDTNNNLSNEATNSGVQIGARTYQYDELGNITYKSDLGYYRYNNGANGARPHAVTSIVDNAGKTVASFTYDSDGNQKSSTINGKTRTIRYSSFDKPLQIIQGNNSVNFYYNADRSRFMRVDKTGNTKTTTLYLGHYEVVSVQTGTDIKTTSKVYVGNDTIHTENNTGGKQDYYLLKDNLGSITGITDSSGDVLKRYHYTPFGEQEDVTKVTQKQHAVSLNKSKQQDSHVAASITNQGFTGHEEVSSMNLIHMNGRMYDPLLGRFLSADPHIQTPDNSQSLNRYTYCLNNPLALTDPSGFFSWHDLVDDIGKIFHQIGHAIDQVLTDKYIGALLQIAASAVAITFQQYWLLPVVAMTEANAAGGGFTDVLQSGVFSAFSELSWGFAGALLHGASLATRVAAQGFVGGSLSGLEGHGFEDGFLAAAVSAAVSGPIDNIDKGAYGFGAIMARGTASGIVGGTVAAAEGGDFINGAETGAFAKMFTDELQHVKTARENQMSSKMEQKIAKEKNKDIRHGDGPSEEDDAEEASGDYDSMSRFFNNNAEEASFYEGKDGYQIENLYEDDDYYDLDQDVGSSIEEDADFSIEEDIDFYMEDIVTGMEEASTYLADSLATGGIAPMLVVTGLLYCGDAY